MSPTNAMRRPRHAHARPHRLGNPAYCYLCQVSKDVPCQPTPSARTKHCRRRSSRLRHTTRKALRSADRHPGRPARRIGHRPEATGDLCMCLEVLPHLCAQPTSCRFSVFWQSAATFLLRNWSSPDSACKAFCALSRSTASPSRRWFCERPSPSSATKPSSMHNCVHLSDAVFWWVSGDMAATPCLLLHVFIRMVTFPFLLLLLLLHDSGRCHASKRACRQCVCSANSQHVFGV